MAAPAPKDTSALSLEVIAYTNGPVLLAKTATFYAVALLTILLRTYSRYFIVKSFGSDDWIMLASMVFATVCFIAYVYQVSLGVGKYIAVIQADEENYRQILKVRQVHMIAVVIGLSLVKVSVAFFLLRLTIRRMYSWFLWGVIVFMGAFTIACVGTLVFQCIPISATWDTRLQPPPIGHGNAKCFSDNTFKDIGLFNGIINILTDFLLALLPVPLIWTLQMNLRSRLSLIVILSLGLFAAVAGIMRQTTTTRNPAETEPWIHDTYVVWNFIELDMGIIAASLPAIKPMFNWFYDTARSLTKATKFTAFGTNGANGYTRQPPRSEIEAFDMVPRKAEQSVRISAHPNEIGDKGLGNNQRANSSEDSILPRTEYAGKGGILVTQCVDVNTA